MSLAFGLGFPHWQTLAGGFSPAALFAAGEQGGWWDCSDFSTLFQDSAGTTPVTAVEQPVGLMLDKSKNAIGTNGAKRVNLLTRTEEFNDAAWSKVQIGSTVPVVTSNQGIAPDGTTTADKVDFGEIDNAGDVSALALNFVFASQTYKNSIYVKAWGAGDIGKKLWFYLFDGAVKGLVSVTLTSDWQLITNLTLTAVGSGSFSISTIGSTFGGENQTAVSALVWGADLRLASEASTLPTYQRITDTWYNTFAGNHAFQTTPTSRPTLSSRVNLLEKTEEFNDAYWGKTRVSVVANATTAPNGSITADKLVEDSTASTTRYLQTTSSARPAGVTSFSVYAKAAERSWLGLSMTNSNAEPYAFFDLANGVVGTVGSATGLITTTSSIENVGNGWYRCTVTWGKSTSAIALIFPSTADNTFSYTGDGTSGIFIWGADLRVANDGVGLPAYQRVDTATSYDTAGFPLYLRYDGSDDGFVTNSVDFATVTSDGQARRNLFTFPTAFDDAAWNKVRTTVTANVESAPDGTNSADKLIETATANDHRIDAPSVSVVSGVVYTFSVYLKAAERVWARVVLSSAGFGTVNANFNLSTGQTGITTGAPSVSITAVGANWYRCTVTATATATTAATNSVQLATADNTISYTGDGTSGIFIWGAQLELGSTATAFQNIGTDAMSVFAGLRKLSDTAEAVVVELSATIASNNGTFRLAAPHAAATSSYEFESKGTVMRDAIGDNFGAPTTNVISGLANISGDSVSIRVNSALEETDAGDQGTGNFGNFPLYIGRRNNTNLPFNGRMYSLIILGRGVTPQQLDQIENYVEQKTFGRALTLTYVDPILTADLEQITMPDGEEIFMSTTYQ
jgi:hypothetical protein